MAWRFLLSVIKGSFTNTVLEVYSQRKDYRSKLKLLKNKKAYAGDPLALPSSGKSKVTVIIVDNLG